MAQPDDLLILATLIKKLSFGDLSTMATLLSEGADDIEGFKWKEPTHVMKLLDGFAETQIEADD